jgi:hypothetical protein
MADLSGADLSVADLSEADLEGATLELAELPGANLRSANLKAANLTRANLSATNLTRANLINTDITEALLLDTTFARVDLRSIRGLEAVTHLGPSTIDIATMVESNGQIPGSFLRGCGVPEPFIVNLRSLIGAMAPIQFYSSFISYSSKDQHFAHRLHADMQARGIRCWFAPEDLKIGDVFSHRVEESIRVHDKMILILSKHSVASSWVRREVEAAREREDREHRDVLFPITLDEAAMQSSEAWAADIRRSRQIGDFKRWKNHDVYQKAFDRLMRDLQKRETSATPS